MPKSTGPGTPAASPFAPLPTETPAPPAPPGQLVPRSFPAPHSYGPSYPPPTPIPDPVQPLRLPNDAVNVLLLGSDRRSGRTFRTDTIILVSIHPSKRAAALISVPRDLYVYLPGFNMQRINAALPLGDSFGYPGGGRAMLADAIQYNLGISVDYFAQVDMSGFQRIVDRLDGIEVHVSCSYTDWRLISPELDPEDEDNWALYTVPAGVVQMNGDLALWYARSRAKSSDFDRARRQQEVLRAMHRRVLRLDLIPKIPELYGEMVEAVSTDLSLTDLIRLAPQAARIEPARVRSRFIGRDQVTSWRTPTGGQVLLPKQDEVRALLESALDFDQPDPLVPDEQISVEVLNASRQQDWATLAAERLTYAGFDAHALRRQVEPTRSRLIDYGRAEPEHRREILSSLGLRSDAWVASDGNGGSVDYTLLVGDNYDPCFDPTRDQR
ncbi:MAG: LCP family protein [Anaerolineales bacterium]|nr:LCP family protein [Anaerolineales bacterium]